MISYLPTVGQVGLDLSGEPGGLGLIRDLVLVELWYEGEADVCQPGPIDVDWKRAGVQSTLDS